MEEYRDIKNYEGIYQVSVDGVCYRLWKKGKQPIKSFNNGKDLHQYVHLCKDGVPVKQYLHRLVAFAFPEICGEWFEGAEVNHKDENPLNNSAYNLEWVTHKQNNSYGTKGDRHSVKISNGIVQQIKDNVVLNEYPSAEKAGRITGINPNSIRNCCKGKYGYKTAGGFVWKFKE